MPKYIPLDGTSRLRPYHILILIGVLSIGAALIPPSSKLVVVSIVDGKTWSTGPLEAGRVHTIWADLLGGRRDDVVLRLDGRLLAVTFVTSKQLNFLLPADTEAGKHLLTVQSRRGTVTVELFVKPWISGVLGADRATCTSSKPCRPGALEIYGGGFVKAVVVSGACGPNAPRAVLRLSVLMNSERLPICYVSPEQINVFVGDRLVGDRVLIVEANGIQSSPFGIRIRK
jgi:hypothetical protein